MCIDSLKHHRCVDERIMRVIAEAVAENATRSELIRCQRRKSLPKMWSSLRDRQEQSA